MTKYAGGCACGALRYKSLSEPKMSMHCQCRQCQRATGTGHASLLIINADDVTITGEAKYFEQSADDGNTVGRGFCPKCGSPVLGKISAHPGVVLIHAASLDDPSLFAPEKVVWSSAKQPWDFIDPNLPTFDQ